MLLAFCARIEEVDARCLVSCVALNINDYPLSLSLSLSLARSCLFLFIYSCLKFETSLSLPPIQQQ